MGMFGALGFAAWLGMPAALLAAVHFRHIRSGMVSPVETAIIALLVAFALFTAWRFRMQRGLIVGPILLVTLVIEVIKRLIMTFEGMLSLGVFDALVTFMIFFGLLNGTRGVRALQHLSPDDDLESVFP